MVLWLFEELFGMLFENVLCIMYTLLTLDHYRVQAFALRC